jgi:uncharacterized protein (TIGR04141 family)
MPHAMEAETKVPTHGLTIYLIKERFQDAKGVLIENARLQHHPIKLGSRAIGDLYVERQRPKPPPWAKFFRGHIDPAQLGQVASSAAVLLMKAQHRLFAVTFGHGRHILDADAWEERFGLRVALNSIGESNVRSIDKRTFDSISRHSREQASRETSARNFQLDVDQDLLRAITGTPTQTDLGRRMSGMDALHVAIPASLDSLRDLLATYVDKYSDTTYLETFPWVDHIAEVSKRSIIDELDAVVAQKLSRRSLEGLWMAVPDVIDWQQVDGFRWAGRQQPLRHDVTLEGFLESLPEADSIDVRTLKNRRVSCLNDNGQELASWQAYRCLHVQLDQPGATYLLSGGNWYRLTRDFVNEVNEAYRRIPRYESQLPTYDDPSETAYNDRIARANPERYALLDGKEIRYGGGQSSVEFCDVLIDGRDILHVKRYGASSLLSHLFSQGLISAELFLVDAQFRQNVNKLLPARWQIKNVEQRPHTDEFRIVFGVISQVGGELTLPFFSRLNARHTVRRLNAFGYQVFLAKIAVDATYSKLKRYKQ